MLTPPLQQFSTHSSQLQTLELWLACLFSSATRAVTEILVFWKFWSRTNFSVFCCFFFWKEGLSLKILVQVYIPFICTVYCSGYGWALQDLWMVDPKTISPLVNVLKLLWYIKPAYISVKHFCDFYAYGFACRAHVFMPQHFCQQQIKGASNASFCQRL